MRFSETVMKPSYRINLLSAVLNIQRALTEQDPVAVSRNLHMILQSLTVESNLAVKDS